MQQIMNENILIVVLSIIMIIWLGIAIYLFKIDSNLKKAESRAKKVIENQINE